MKVLLNLLKAFVIVIGLYLLSVAGMVATYFIVMNNNRSNSNGATDGMVSGAAFNPGGFVALTALFVLLAFAALYLPPIGRLFAAIATFIGIVALWIWFGILLTNMFR